MGVSDRKHSWILFLHKEQDVIVWRVEQSPDNPEKLIIFYSYLRDNGRVGKPRIKSVWEDDFYEEFESVGKGVQLRWKLDEG